MKMKSIVPMFAVAVLLAASFAAFLPNENVNPYEFDDGTLGLPGESPYVTNITGVPTSAIVGVPLTLGGTVAPNTANQTISWSIKNAGGTGATINGNVFTAESEGTVTITATVGAFTMVSSGYDHTVALKADGTLWVWGSNEYGQLGIGSSISSKNVPIQMDSATDWVYVSAGYFHTIAIKDDGSMWAWGRNNNGQLGITGGGRYTPFPVASSDGVDNNWASVSAGFNHTAAIREDGTLWSWGYNLYGEVGDGTTTRRNTPVQIVSSDSIDNQWAQVSAGGQHTMAIREDGTLWSWGLNSSGQLGLDDAANRSSPTKLTSGTITTWRYVSAGDLYTAGIKADGSLWTWGDNTYNQLCFDKDTINLRVPEMISWTFDWASVSAGYQHGMAVKEDGTMYSWGRNNNGQLGDGTTTNKFTLTEIGKNSKWASVSAGSYHAAAITTDGLLWTCGKNHLGQLGDTSTTQRNILAKIGVSDWVQVSASGSHSLALKSDGTVWAWGSNINGQLGDGTTTYRSTPAQVTSLTNVIAISAGREHSLALKSDGTVWVWGSNRNGQLGDGTTTYRSTPAQVTSLTNVIAISAGLEHSLALKSDGTVWAWGNNNDGQFGNGTTVSSSTPVQVTSLTNVTAISAGLYHSLALKSDGTVWAWGSNYYGLLGNGMITSSLTPTQVTSLTGVTAISAGWYHSLALKSDGTVWAWGSNYSGLPGNGMITSSLTPTQVTSLTGVTAISAGLEHSLALKSDGTLWAWGNNIDGQFGNGTTVSSSTPVQVTSLTNVTAISAGVYHSLALKSDGTLWAWGSNSQGQLGDGTTTPRYYPVKIGSLQYTKEDFIITVNAPTYAVSVTGGTATPASGKTGTSVELMIGIPPENKQFKGWNVVSGGVTITDNTFTIEASNVVIEAVWEDIPPEMYTITIIGGNASHTSGTAGTPVALTAGTPEDGMRFSEWKVVSGAVIIIGNTFTVGTGNVIIEAVWEYITYTITVNGGTASPASGTIGTTVELTVGTPPGGKLFVEWEVVSGEVTIIDDAFIIGTSDVEIEAVWNDIPVVGYQFPFTDEDGNTLLYTVTTYNSEVSVSGYVTASGDIEIPYSVVYDGITHVVTSIEDFAFQDCSGLKSVAMSSVVTSIGVNAFRDCSDLASIVISDSVTYIGGFAFFGCTDLSSVTMGVSTNEILDYTFFGCSKLKSIDLSYITYIGDFAFYECTDLSSVTIPGSVTYIGEFAFFDCTGLGAMAIPYALEPTLSDNAISPATIIIWYEGVASVTATMDDGETIELSVVPNTGEEHTGITVGTTYGGSDVALTGMTFTATGMEYFVAVSYEPLTYTVTYDLNEGNGTVPTESDKIYEETFYAASAGGLTAPEGMLFKEWNTELDGSGTSYAPGAEVTMPASALTLYAIWKYIHVVGYQFFFTGADGNTLLYTVTVYDSEVSVSGYIRASGDLVIPDSVTYDGTVYSVTSIGEYAFFGCWDLESVAIPDSVTYIGNYAFAVCSNLVNIDVDPSNPSYTSVGGVLFTKDKKTLVQYPAGLAGHYDIPDSVRSIGAGAFYSCTGLTSVTIPASVTSVGDAVFYDCTGLAAVAIPYALESPISGGTVPSDTMIVWYEGAASVTATTEDGETIELYVVLNAETEFLGITVGTTYGASDVSVTGSDPWTFTASAAEYFVTIESAVIYYALTVTDGTGSGEYALGENVIITANEAPAGKRFDGWTASGMTLTNPGDPSMSFAMPANAVTVTANYEDLATGTYAVNVLNDGNGTAVADVSFATAGTDITLTAAPSAGYKFKEWQITEGGVSITDNVFVMPSQNVTIVAIFALAEYTVTVVNGTGSGEYEFGGTVNITADAPTSGMVFDKWTSDDVKFDNANSVTATFTMPTHPVTVTATYKPMTYAVTVVNGTGSGNYLPGETVEITAGEPAIGKVFDKWISDDITLIHENIETALFNMPAYSVTITATYKDVVYTVTYVITGGDGETPTESGKIYEETFDAASADGFTPPAGLLFKEWNTEPDGNGTSYAPDDEVTMTADALTLYAIWKGTPAVGYQFPFTGEDGNTLLYTVTVYGSEVSVSGYVKASGDMVIPDSVRYSDIDYKVENIGMYAFFECTDIRSVSVPDSVTFIWIYAFYGCINMDSVTIGYSVHTIGGFAFQNCTGLKSVSIPDSVTEIGLYAFSGCTSLKAVIIPDSVTLIRGGAFSGCTDLTAIYTDPSNQSYVSIDGVLFTKDGKTLVQYPGGMAGHYDIPDSVQTIGFGAFYGSVRLTSLSIPDSVTSIGNEAFGECTGLTSVTIPSSVIEIGAGAFYECTNLAVAAIPYALESTLPSNAVPSETIIIWYEGAASVTAATDGGETIELSVVPNIGKEYTGITVGTTHGGSDVSLTGMTFTATGMEYFVAVSSASITYSVTYDANEGDGTVPTESVKEYEETFNAASAGGLTALEGMRFVEWNTESDGSGTGYAAGAPIIMPDHDLTLYAIWEISTYEVKYVIVNGTWGGTLTEITETVTHGDTLADIPANAIPIAGYGHTPGSWDTIPTASTAVTSDTVFTYTYGVKNTYTVTYIVINGTWGGTLTEVTETVTYGDTPADIPANMLPDAAYTQDEGYWFGTPPASTAVTSNRQFVYMYDVKNTYEVKYVVVNGTWGGTLTEVTETVTHGDTLADIPANAIPIAGYGHTPGSWDTIPTASTAVTSDMVFTYTYGVKNTYTVTYIVINGTWGGTLTEVTETVTYGDTPADIPANMTPGAAYTLTGGSWSTPAPAASTVVTSAMVFTYTYDTMKTYEVTLTTGTGYTLTTSSSATVTHGGSFTFSFALNIDYSDSSFSIFVNDEKITMTDGGEYTIPDITGAITVRVEGVERNVHEFVPTPPASWVKGSAGNFVMIVDADESGFRELWMNDVKLTKGTHYTVTSGSTVITILSSYLETLTAGPYSIVAEFVDGAASASLLISAPSGDGGDETGDEESGDETGDEENGNGGGMDMMIIIAIVAVIAIVGIGAAFFLMKKK